MGVDAYQATFDEHIAKLMANSESELDKEAKLEQPGYLNILLEDRTTKDKSGTKFKIEDLTAVHMMEYQEALRQF